MKEYTFYVDGSHRFENVNGDTREEALHDAAFLLNADEKELIELQQLLPIGDCYFDENGNLVDTVQ